MASHLPCSFIQHRSQSLTSHCSQTCAVFTAWPHPECPALPPSAASQDPSLVTVAAVYNLQLRNSEQAQGSSTRL